MHWRWVPESRQWQQLFWDHENQLKQVDNWTTGTVIESYAYDDSGIRIRKTSNGTSTYYPNQFYEQRAPSGLPSVTKYYYFNGAQGAPRIAMRHMDSGAYLPVDTFTYLHSDHLSSTVLETDTSGNIVNDQGYYAYGRQRRGSTLATDHTFTGQKRDGTGLLYYNARYYDPAIGTFISPDTIVPDVTNLFDYNRYMYVRGRVLNANDPTGHNMAMFDGGPCPPYHYSCRPKKYLSSREAAKQEAEVDLIVQATTSVLLGDINDVLTVASGYDVISDESVPYFSEEWAETLGWMALPLGSRSGAKAVEGIVDETAEIVSKNADEVVYGEHVLKRMADNPNDLGHNFPTLLDAEILSGTPAVTRANGQQEFLRRGSLNETNGVYHITLGSDGKTITHRFFIGESDWDRFATKHGLSELEDIP